MIKCLCFNPFIRTVKLFIVVLIVSNCSVLFGQVDTTTVSEYEEVVDSSYYEDNPNYIGVNLTPFFTSIMGNQNADVKVSLIYKRNRGDKNFRFSANYLTASNKSKFHYYNVISTSDTSYTARFFTDHYRNFDIRIGFEELKGYQYSRLHIGADVILGGGNYEYRYFVNKFDLDSSSNYKLNTNEATQQQGSIKGNYINMGLAVSFGFDWFISDDLLFTFQLTPQFTYHMLNSSKLEDNYGVYTKLNNFTDFKLGYFDVMMFYRF